MSAEMVTVWVTTPSLVPSDHDEDWHESYCEALDALQEAADIGIDDWPSEADDTPHKLTLTIELRRVPRSEWEALGDE